MLTSALQPPFPLLQFPYHHSEPGAWRSESLLAADFAVDGEREQEFVSLSRSACVCGVTSTLFRRNPCWLSWPFVRRHQQAIVVQRPPPQGWVMGGFRNAFGFRVSAERVHGLMMTFCFICQFCIPFSPFSFPLSSSSECRMARAVS